MNTIKFKEELNFDIKEYNHMRDLSELMICGKKMRVTMDFNDNEEGNIYGHLKHRFRETDENVFISIAFNKQYLISIEMELSSESDDYNEYDLKHFYYDEIQNSLYKYRNIKKYKYTIRNYRAIYNSYAIKGKYEINGKNKFQFFTLYPIDRTSEPMTEHIIAFDVKVEETSLDRARSLVHNLVSDYCAFLSVLLNIGFEDINSKYLNYVIMNKVSGEVAHQRHRTAFTDEKLGFIVKDNYNGLMHKKDMNKEPLLGYVSYSMMNSGNIVVTEKIGDTPNLIETFTKHRMYKAKIKSENEYIDEIDDDIPYLNNPIPVPRKIRQYFKSIFSLEETDYKKYQYFRNACRLYNLSYLLANISPTATISYMISAIETLGKAEGLNFSQFIKEFNKEVDSKLIDFMYGKVRSGHFHSGEFSFREYDFELNVSANPIFFLSRNDNNTAKHQLRKAFVNWINRNLITKEK